MRVANPRKAIWDAIARARAWSSPGTQHIPAMLKGADMSTADVVIRAIDAPARR
jgi:hypothetical protein